MNIKKEIVSCVINQYFKSKIAVCKKLIND